MAISAGLGVFIGVFIGIMLGLLFPIYAGRAMAIKSWRIFVPRKDTYWQHKETGLIVRVDTTACEVWYGYVVSQHLGDNYLDLGSHRSMAVNSFCKTFEKLNKKQAKEELEAEKGLRALQEL